MQNLKRRFLNQKQKTKDCFSSSTLRWRTEFFLTDEGAQNFMEEVLSALSADHSFLPSLSLSLSLYTCRGGALSFITMFVANLLWTKISCAESVFGAFFQLYIIHDSKIHTHRCYEALSCKHCAWHRRKQISFQLGT